MKNRKKLVFATNNEHKLQEARQIISNNFEIISLAEIGCHDDIPETSDTLQGNALIKARWIKEKYGYDCFADDTGLMVDALGGAPGVLSARYAGEGCTPSDNLNKLLQEMKDSEERAAHFATVVALIRDGKEYFFEGKVEGRIANTPHGDGGFGYDPVFIEKESGKCFAEMTSEEKNSVSHRGKAMRKLRDFLSVITIILISCLLPQIAHAEQWRLHPSFDGQILQICETPDYVYFVGAKQQYNFQGDYASTLHGILFRYDKAGDELTYLNSQNLTSGNTVKAAAYNYSDKYLAVAYDDGTIDLIYDNGIIKPVYGLMAADNTLDKTVNDFTFNYKTGKIYAATNFGYLILDGWNGVIDTSRNYDKKINSVYLKDNILLLGTEDGLYYGNPNDFNLSNFQKILDGEFVQMLSECGSSIFFVTRKSNDLQLYRLESSGDSLQPILISNTAERSIQRGENSIITSAMTSIRRIDSQGNYYIYSLPQQFHGSFVSSMNGKQYWMSSNRKGFACLQSPSGQNDQWTVLKDRFFPNASSAFQCSSMAYHPNYGMLVRNHGYEMAFSDNIITTFDLISGYKDMNWSRLSTTYRTDMGGLTIDSPFGLAIDPNNTDHVYCGSERSGLLRLNLKEPEKSIHMSKPSDWLGGNGQPGFATIVADNPEGTWAEQCVFAAPGFDNYGNLWTAYVNPEPGENSSSYCELWVWPAEARANTTDYTNVHGFKKIKIEGVATSNWPVVYPLKSSVNKNIVLHHGNRMDMPMLIIDHGGTLDTRSDDRVVKMKTIHDQDGESVSLERAYAIYEDVNTGLVWVSPGKGIFTFNPTEALVDPTSVRRIKVARNDGTNLADYLLDGVTVNCITADASGRKWFGTLGAGLVCTSSDGREILATYTRDNSQLPGDDVYSVCYNPSSGSMMISTNNGLCELFLDGASEDGNSGVKAYPNPVHPDYYGYVTVEGLPESAMVKIVDTGGNLVKEVGSAFNGSVEWDVTNMFSKRVPGGVYFVIASNGPDSNSFNKVAKILVIN